MKIDSTCDVSAQKSEFIRAANQTNLVCVKLLCVEYEKYQQPVWTVSDKIGLFSSLFSDYFQTI